MKSDFSVVALASVSLFLSLNVCAAEPIKYTAPEYTRHETQSYFVPGEGTKNLVYAANSLPLVFSGEAFPSDMIVASDVGTNISRYRATGELAWRVVTYPATVRAVSVNGNTVYAFAGNTKLSLDADTGNILGKEVIDSAYLFNKVDGQTKLSGLNSSGKGTVHVNGKLHCQAGSAVKGHL
ncbi:hypothetical protein [Pseudomonas sp. AE27]|uniref:hypothetical protein n=1 Tax=Pseudomonas sp. AE27 TaxID=3127460 RepID=UPI0030D1A1F0